MQWSVMPATFLHPAAVLPLFRSPLVPAALVAGSVAPDLPYVLRELPVEVSAQDWYRNFFNATESHTWPGLAVYGLPVAAVLLLVWLAVRLPVLDLLGVVPDPPAPGRLRTLAWCLPSAFIGILTHVAWDRLAHREGLWRLLTAATMAVAAVSLVRWLWVRRRPGIRWRLLATLGGLALVVALLAVARSLRAGYATEAVLRDFVFAAVLAAGLVVAAWAAWWHGTRLTTARSARA
jgi:hypothetical protein